MGNVENTISEPVDFNNFASGARFQAPPPPPPTQFIIGSAVPVPHLTSYS